MWQVTEGCQVRCMGIGRGACREPPGPRSGPAHRTRGVVRYSEPPRGRWAAAPTPNRTSEARSAKHLYPGGPP
jgi:hypothetical protein